ncbi:hypothetical protein CBR_g25916 [Chara braunii]|uniref:Ubiquitin-like protease family profile domain-containing protein n=1 Tax=Chara braunii TaxID=69332 RepID=A0A388L702_CHABU|nr:hypothetical protein CBR_g25916 [Chara braunii]|eukprot:GBG77983.1 hypothetical protein CBR_g25916 [Chara braunii]
MEVMSENVPRERGRGGQEHGVGKRLSKEEGAATSKKARRPDGLTIREGQAMGGGDSAHPGAPAAREPSGKSKRKVAAEEDDGQNKPRRRKTAEAAGGGEQAVGKQYDEAAAFRLEYERNDDGEIVEKELPVQLFIDPRKVCDILPWERYYNHRCLNRENVDDIKAAMLSRFHKEKGKIWTKNPLVLAPIYNPVTHRPEIADRVHKDVFKPEDKDKYYCYPKAAFEDMWEAWEKEGRPVAIQGNPSNKEAEKQKFFDFQKLILGKSPNDSHWSLAKKDMALTDKEYVVAVGNALRQWMPLVTAGNVVFRKGMEFYEKWAEGKLLGGDGKTSLLRSGKYMPNKSPGLQAIPEMGSKGAAGETKMGSLVGVPPPPTKKRTQADDKFFMVVKEPDMFCWQCLAIMTDAEKLSILDDILGLRAVFVPSAGGHPKCQYKPRVKDMVAAWKVDPVMLRLFHYILFLETEENEAVWRYRSTFFRTEGQLLAESGPRGLTKQVWVELRKHFKGTVEYVNTCKRSLLHQKESLDDAKRLYEDDMPSSQTDLEYSRRRNLVFGVLNGYHDAPRESVSHFLRRLEHVYFVVAETLTLENYKAQFDLEDPFDAEDMEELSDSETFDFESMPFPRVVGQTAHNLRKRGRAKRRREKRHPAERGHAGEKGLGEKASGGKGSGGKDLGGKGSGGKGSGGKGLGGKGSGGKRRTFASPQYMETDPHCVGSRDSDMRDATTLRSNQVRVDSHLSTRTLFPNAEENPSRHAQQRSPVLNTLLLEEGGRVQQTAAAPMRRDHSLIGTASSFCLEGGRPALRRTEGATFSSLSSGERHKLQIDSEFLTSPWRPSPTSAPHATVPRGEENVTSYPPHLQLGTGFPCSAPFSFAETRDWRSRVLLEGPPAGVLETGFGEYERHASEGEPLDGDSESASAPRAEEHSPGTLLEIGGSEWERHASEGASVDTDSESALQREEDTKHWPACEVVKGLDAGVLVSGTSEEVRHSRSAVATMREGVVKGGHWMFVQAPVLGDDEGEEGPAVEARVHGNEKGGEPVVEGGEVTVGVQTDPQRKDDDSSPTRCGEEQGDRPSVLSTRREIVVHEAIELGNDSAATELVNDSGVAEVHNVESSVEGGEVAVNIKMDPERKDHDSPSTRCSEEQGDRASVLSTGREMVLHEAIGLPSDSAATKLVSDTTVAEVSNVESSIDVGAVARQEGGFHRRAPDHVPFSIPSSSMAVIDMIGLRDGQDVDIFSYEMVLVPVHKNRVHWILLYVREQWLEYYDSLLQDDGGFSSDVIANFEQYLRDEAVCYYGQTTKLDLQEPKVVVHDVPQQSDRWSRGVFMLTFTLLLARGYPPPFPMAQSDIPNIRLRIAMDILQGSK